MFVRKKSSPSNPNTYVQLIESSRVDGKVRQRVIKHIGTAIDAQQLEQLMLLGEQLKALYNNGTSEQEIEIIYQQELSKIQGSKHSILNCDKVAHKVTGIHDIYGHIFDELNLSTIFDNDKYYTAFKDTIMARIAKPSSKRQTVDILLKDFGIEHTLNTIYRMMDRINDTTIQDIQNKIAQHTKRIMGGTIKVLFYDVTTIYFESFTADELRKLGYSKDNKFNQPQIVLTMLVTDKGLPLGYQLLPGNTYEGNTLLAAIQQWQKIYSEQKFVLVADSGMLNSTNLDTLEQLGIDFIVCARIKSLPKARKKELLEYKDAQENNKDFYHTIEFASNRKLILSYKSSRACKDKYDREKSVARLTDKLKVSKNPANLISNYGYKKFISIDSDSSVKLNDSKVAEAERWDGLHGLITNMKDITAQQAYDHYKGLWQIEDSFRINKTDLKIRPIFHWNAERINAHIAISFVSYACYKFVECMVKQHGDVNLSHRQIKEELMNIGLNIFKDRYSEEHFAIPNPITPTCITIYSVFNIRPETQGYRCTLAMAS